MSKEDKKKYYIKYNKKKNVNDVKETNIEINTDDELTYIEEQKNEEEMNKIINDKEEEKVSDEKEIINNDNNTEDISLKSKKIPTYFTFENRIIIRIAVCLISFLLFAIFLVLSIRLNVVSNLRYYQSSNLDYKVNLKDNNYYTEKSLGKNMTYIASLIKNIDVTFNYNFRTTKPIDYKYTYYVTGEVKVTSDSGSNTIYSKKENIINEQTVTMNNSSSFNIKKDLAIDYNKYNNIIKGFKSEYGINASSDLVVTLFVKVTDLDGNAVNKVDANNSMNITIPLTQQMVNIKMDYKEVNNSDTFKAKTNVNINNKVLFVTSIVFAIANIISLFSLFVFLGKLSKKKSKYQKELSKILREFDRVIVESKNDIIIDKEQEIINVKTFGELLDVRDNLEKPILFKEIHKGQKSEFFVKNSYEVYKFTLKAVDLEKNNKKGK